MFHIKIHNVGELYETLEAMKDVPAKNRTSGIPSGFLNFDSNPIQSLETYIYPYESRGYQVKSNIVVLFNHTPHIEPFQELVDREYKMISLGERQVILEKDGREYIAENIEPYFYVTVSSPNLGTQEEFEQVLQDYALFLQTTVEAFYKNHGTKVPDARYDIGRNAHREKLVASLRTSETSSETPKPDSKLESRIEVVTPNVSFDDIGGCQQGKLEMERIYNDIAHPERAAFFGRDPTKKKGYLLLGDSGNGKTLLIKALATKLKDKLDGKVKFYLVNYEDITSIFRGGEAQATGDLFRLAEENERQGLYTLMFLDEIHLIGSRRKGSQGPKDEGLDTLLTHLDGARDYKGLTVVGATYLPVEELDPALIRSGRLSKHVTIEKPNADERQEIFEIYLRKFREMAAQHGNEHLFGELDLQNLAQAAAGFNGSDVSGLVQATIDRKEDETMAQLTGEATTEKIADVFIPITTGDFLTVMKTYQKKERQRPVGFARD